MTKRFKVDEYILHKEFEALNEKYFNFDTFSTGEQRVKLEVKKRKKSAGMCSYSRERYSSVLHDVKITMSSSYTYKNREQFLGVLLHEMIHAELTLEGYFRHGHGLLFQDKVHLYSTITGIDIPMNNDLFEMDGGQSFSIDSDSEYIALVAHDKKVNKYYARPVAEKAFKVDILITNFRDRLGMDEIYFVKTSDPKINTLPYISKPDAQRISLSQIPNKVAEQLLNTCNHI